MGSLEPLHKVLWQRGAVAAANLQRLDKVCIEQIIRMVAMMAMWMITLRVTMMVKLMMPGYALA